MGRRILFGVAAAMLLFSASGCAASVNGEAGGTAGKETETAYVQNRPDKIDGIEINDHTAVVIDTVADVFSEPEVRSDRLTQVFYNQPVSVLEQQTGWSKIVAVDGSVGWVRSKYLESDISSIYGKICTGRIVVTSREKAVYSQPKGGVTLKDAMMGTIFYTFNSADEAYEVYLPGNTTGWLRGSGIIHIGLEEAVPKTTAEDFAATAQKFKGAGYLWKGLSGRGLDSCGLLYLCAAINGVRLPRQPEQQLNSGKSVPVGNADEIAALKPGDLLYFTTDTDSGKESYSGIYLGEGKYIYSSKASGYVKIDKIVNKNPEGVLTSAGRIFDNDGSDSQ